MQRDRSAAARPSSPTAGGLPPRKRTPSPLALSWSIALASGAAAIVVGCSNNASDQQTRPVELGMTNSIPPYYSDPNLTIYEVQKPVALPVRKPRGSEMSGAPPAGTPYTHAPYLRASDESVEVHYTISNLDDRPNSVWLLIDPWNEFVRWNPGVTVVNGDETVPNLGYDLAFEVPAKSRVQGTITSDDFIEIATKLASVQNLLASSQAMQVADAGAGASDTFDARGLANHIFNPQNRSNEPDPYYQPWIPSVIAGVTGFDLGLRTYDAAANVAVEITIDLVDHGGNRLVPADSNDPQLGPPPKSLSPPAARVL